LLPDYACTGQSDVLAGYQAVDADGDGLLDTCIAIGTTTCDTTMDGLADMYCIIEFSAAIG